MSPAERTCVGCGYNLRGLPAGGRCPECGMPMQMPGKVDDPLSLMPMSVIKTFRAACWAATACAVALLVLALGGRWLGLTPTSRATALVALAVFWQGATWLLTPALALPQAVFHGFAHTATLRKAARSLQPGWVIAAFGGLAVTLKPGAADPLIVAGMWVGLALGMAGLVALGVMLQRLAYWARDDVAERAFTFATWGIPITTLCLVFGMPIVAVGRIACVLIALWGVFIAAFPVGLLSLSGSMSWTVLHAREHQDRTRRRRRRAEEHFGQMVDRSAETEAIHAERTDDG